MDSGAVPRVGRSRWWVAALGVSFLALLALALVPAFLARQEAALERELTVFSLARPMIPEIQLVYDREMTEVERFVSSGDSSSIARYRGHLERESQLLSDLRRVISGMPPTYLVELSRVETHNRNWKVLHSELMGERPLSTDLPPLPGESPLSTDPRAFRDRMEDDRARYDSVRVAVRTFEDRLIRDAAVARSRLEIQRMWQFWVTLGTVGLAVLGVFSMMFVGLRLQNLARRETQRRLETVTVRRDMRSILRGTADGLIGVDQDGNCTFLNEAGSRLLGYSPRELRGQAVHRRIHHTKADGGKHSESDCPVHMALGSGETVRVPDDVLWRKDGTSFPVQLIISPMKDGRNVRGVVLTFTDMTEIRAAEAALRDAVRARDEVLAVVSHDLRNPVGTIAAAAELLADVPMPSERRGEHLEIIARAAERINRLIQDLLDVAQIEAGRLSVRTKSVDMTEVFEEVFSQMRWEADEEGVELTVRVPADLPPVEADRDRIVQVMSNLIDNGLKFTEAGGRVTVAASRAPGGVSVTVSDTGPGIESEMEQHLFDRFWKGHADGTRGAGLGLAIVDGILQAHGTRIEVETEVGRGSAFSFTLRTGD
ncbi:MAG: PAS domain S-box protein [Gemmatimonadetes bacterium]|nr:PAS domain S-box protein [Gemmatimonadota bacterium]